VKTNFTIIIALPFLLFYLAGCMSFTTLQSPKTLEPGEVILGAGTALPATEKKISPLVELNSRFGIAENLDFGAKISASSVIFLDGKYQVIGDPVAISLDLGWSYFSISDGIGGLDGKSTCWYPMIIAGQDNWYIAVKKVYMSTSGRVKLISDIEFEGNGWFSTNVTVGGILGEKLRLIPEVNFVMPDGGGKTIIIPAVGVQIVL
jgi:hypothetical protein